MHKKNKRYRFKLKLQTSEGKLNDLRNTQEYTPQQ